ncbi:2-hydroxy-6-oxononadienedioate/2-hydroxy-6-oxononatrienedioate hydrolase [Marinomonas spartinae]|uniref:2-hydroxy-6-oxononadienedioate/2-hydroxy-6-oxononatrienedioate hydrolase n=1 Tax=Marinomonas spartinae TaxID=1792290 RepID=A0A1A8TPA7_9GAMM|nr:alpha/beta hydrolase [Marinomonas spartinae]SBS34873.1 2-hydroxy-6-oxononadienedioate/2-hydroxy-6-oxononatrienedioate hydrolase [Marinomonas spartinae]
MTLVNTEEKVIYCLPGTMCDERLWQFIEKVLVGITLKHVPLPQEESIEAIVESLSASLPTSPFFLLGFSMGGYVASAFTLKYPDRVAKLMVVSNTAQGLQESEIAQRKLALNWVAKKGYKGIPPKKAMSMLAQRNRQHEYLIELIKEMDASLGEKVLIQQLASSLDRPDILCDLLNLSIPLCFCLGEEDSLISAQSRRSLEECKSATQAGKRVEVYVASHCGHMVTLEQPLWLCQKIKVFFGWLEG